ncbi:uncharacterized protein LOC143465303 [Clavelina lepadiformis]|uniref:uncharacterized protein LOC143465303 n=1 Tax=Clavelina lepadiformis TaxID=159417 RepID=UPI0040425D54
MHNVYQVVAYPEWMVQKKISVSCFMRGLTSVPVSLNPDLEILNLNRNLIQNLRKGELQTYRSLVALLISNNCLPYQLYHLRIPRCKTYFVIEKGTFQDLLNLKYLDIGGNNIKQLPDDLPNTLVILVAVYTSMMPTEEKVLSHLKNLKILLLSSNCIMRDLKHFCRGNFTIHGNPFRSINLIYLDVGFNSWTKIPAELLVPSLRGFRIRGNPILTVGKESFLNSPNLTHLILSWVSQYNQKRLIITGDFIRPLTKLEHLDLAGNMLTTLPKGFLETNTRLKYLNLKFNCLHAVSGPIFLPYLPNLQELLLSGNTFCAELHPENLVVPELRLGDSFRRFPNLISLSLGAPEDTTWINKYLAHGKKYLSVNKNSLKVLKDLKNFKTIILGGCGVLSLDLSAFSGLSLTSINLSINQIGEAPMLAEQRSQRKKKDIKNNRKFMDEITAEILEELEAYYVEKEVNTAKARFISNGTNRLNLGRNAIRNISKYDFRFVPLINHLDLSYNSINYIYRTTFRPLKHLKVLDLRYNPLRYVSSDVFNKLFDLSVVYMNLTKYEATMTSTFLNSLQSPISLHIGAMKAGNLLWSPQLKRQEKFEMVTKLDISGNQFQSYVISTNQIIFASFPNITSLNLQYCNIYFTPESNFFHGLPKLKRVDLSHNFLAFFPYVALHHVPHLEYLDLSYNNIGELKNDLSKGLPHLTSLILSHNLIRYIAPGVIAKAVLKHLVYLDLSFNSISDVGPTIFDRQALTDLKHLDLRGNLIECTCSLTHTFGWWARSGKLKDSSTPGLLPVCPNVVFDYFGGCVACSEEQLSGHVRTKQSLLTFSSSYPCVPTLQVLYFAVFTGIVSLMLVLGLVSRTDLVRTCAKALRAKYTKTRPFLSDTEDSDDKRDKTYVYHGFVFYDLNDDNVGDWIDYCLVPRLENGNPPFKIGIVGKEDYCGAAQVKQLLLRMEASRKVIVVLTGTFATTPKCKYVLSVLEDWIYTTGYDRCVLVTFEDDPQFGSWIGRRRRMHPQFTLQYSAETDEEKAFWSPLRSSLEKTSKSKFNVLQDLLELKRCYF